MKNKIFILVAAVVAVGSFFLVKVLNSDSVPAEAPKAAFIENFIRPHSPTFGNPMARVTVVEWFDPECEACRMMHPIVKKIMKDYKDRVYFVFRYMPYHGNSMFAASALEEARELNKFEEALDALYEAQPEWGDHHQPRPELIPNILAKVGIPKDKLDANYLIEKHGSKVRIDEADGKDVGVRGTPSFFVNGMLLRELGEEQLRSAIDLELEQ